jgi:hypothetical protein
MMNTSNFKEQKKRKNVSRRKIVKEEEAKSGNLSTLSLKPLGWAA